MEDVYEAFGLQVLSTKEIQGNVWRLRTAGGDFALKRSYLLAKRLEFIDGAERKLQKNGFLYFAQPVATASGMPFHQKGDNLYTLNEWVDGVRCDFDDLTHLQKSAATLGKFHLLGRGVDAGCYRGARVSYFDWPDKLRQRSEEMEHFAVLARRGKPTYFKRMYLSFYRPFRRKAEQARKQLLTSAYGRLAAESERTGSFIHYDVASRNFIIQDAAYLIDFDYCALELPAVDLMRLIKRSLKYGEESERKLDVILSGYCDQRPLYRDEAEVVCALLLFPQKFWCLGKRYFEGEKDWDEETFAKRMHRAVAELEREEGWLEELRKRL